MLRVLHLPTDEGAVLKELTGDEARSFLLNPQRSGQIWVDIENQNQRDIDLLAQSFKFHPLALEDCLHFNQRSKLEEYSGANPYLFIVTHTAVVVPELPAGLSNDESSMVMQRVMVARGPKRMITLQMLEVHAFLGQNFLVTIHADPIGAAETLFQRVRRDGQILTRGVDFIYYQLADLLTDANFPVLENLGDLLDNLEESITDPGKSSRDAYACINSLRKALVNMRRTLSPQRDIMGALSRQGGGNTCVTPRTAPYFRDVYDHLTRIYESIEAGRDLLASCIDAYHSTVAQRTNDTMRQLTGLSGILLPMTFVTGFFGMNFTSMPFSSTTFFWGSMVVMLAAAIVLYLVFRRRQWIG